MSYHESKGEDSYRTKNMLFQRDSVTAKMTTELMSAAQNGFVEHKQSKTRSDYTAPTAPLCAKLFMMTGRKIWQRHAGSWTAAIW